MDYIKEKALKEIDRHAAEIIELGKSIFDEPETGYREYSTSRKLEKFFNDLSVDYEKDIAITGIIGKLNSNNLRPTVAILSELDALINTEHPNSDKVTGAVHACGHFAQVSWMAGALIGLKCVSNELHGNILFMGIPAEEFIELDYRNTLKAEGKIHYFGGKQEFIRLGYFDNVDIAIMNHAHSDKPSRSVQIIRQSNGFMGKSIKFLGRSAHAGAAPHLGINALNMFNVALSAINAQRETFLDSDSVRIHMIITKGGESVNVVPGEVDVEMYVRGRTIEVIKETGKKVDNALKSGALGIGGHVEIKTIPGYLPLHAEPLLNDLWKDNASFLLGKNLVFEKASIGASTDMGDVSHILPSIEPSSGGFFGDLHSKDFKVQDEEMAFIIPAKLYAMTVIDLLSQGGRKARKIIDTHEPLLTVKEYKKLMDSMFYRYIWPE